MCHQVVNLNSFMSSMSFMTLDFFKNDHNVLLTYLEITGASRAMAGKRTHPQIQQPWGRRNLHARATFSFKVKIKYILGSGFIYKIINSKINIITSVYYCWCRNGATEIELNRSIHGKLVESLDDTAVALSRRAHEHFPLQSVKDR
jgi:hypothetical protein